MELAAEQQAAVDMALAQHNLFITGGPGTGKSFTLQNIIAALRAKNGIHSVLVIAPTGVAAMLIGGQTMHSKPGPGLVKSTSMSFKNMWNSASEWRRLKTIVVDEISMVDGEFFDWYYATIQEIRKAGIQVIVCGDFFQLPPVASGYGKRSIMQTTPDSGSAFKTFVEQCAADLGNTINVPVELKECCGKYAFQTACWREAKFKVCVLNRCFRTNDDVLLNALSDIRAGRSSSPSITRLVMATSRTLGEDHGIKATMLFSTRAAVTGLNESQLQLCLASTKHTFNAIDSVRADQDYATIELRGDRFFTSDCPAQSTLELRIGAQVMMLVNEQVFTQRECRLVNGSRGVVIAFRQVLFEEPAAENPVVKRARMLEYPEVLFTNGRRVLIEPVQFSKTIYLKGECIRMQVPLTLAWAITIHKSQGASLSKVTVDLNNCFEPGMAYVLMLPICPSYIYSCVGCIKPRAKH